MENERRLTFIDENGDEILCEILFTFDSEEFGKSYVFFYPVGEESEDGQIEVMAAAYNPGEGGTGELFPIETDEEWEMVENVLNSFDEEDCDCGHDHDHECECEHDEDDEEDEDHECCCGHNHHR